MGRPTLKLRKPKALPLAVITIDPRLQPRAGELNEEHVTDLVDALKRRDRLPPLVVFRDRNGKYWLASGFHRAEAFRRAGRKDAPCEIREGEWANALAFACGQNRDHGLKRTIADKLRAVGLLVEAFPGWTNPLIAKAAAVSTEFVRKHRPNDGTPRRGADGKEYPPARHSDERQSATVADSLPPTDDDSGPNLFSEPAEAAPKGDAKLQAELAPKDKPEATCAHGGKQKPGGTSGDKAAEAVDALKEALDAVTAESGCAAVMTAARDNRLEYREGDDGLHWPTLEAIRNTLAQLGVRR